MIGEWWKRVIGREFELSRALHKVAQRHPMVSIVIADAVARWFTSGTVRAEHKTQASYALWVASELEQAAVALRAAVASTSSAESMSADVRVATTSAPESKSGDHHRRSTSASGSEPLDHSHVPKDPL